ncbi:MAG: polysaccharide biosynthesis/export family protein [Pseudomonadota bacterium]
MNIREWIIGAAGCLAMVTVAACQSAPVSTDAPTTAPVTPTGETISISSPAYILGNGDRLRVTVFDEPELSGEFLVDGTGQVSIPLVGEIPASGKSVRDFQRELETQLGDGFLVEPRVSAEVINFRPYYILGEVGRPGEYPYTDALTVMNAVATAEGFSYRANKRTVFIRGADDTKERSVRLTPDLKVQPGDTIRIGERLF